MGITKPEIMISRETIKPSSPTPHSKRIYKISVIDQLSSGFDVAIIIFYQNKEGNNNNNSAISTGLIKKSLSETLTHYYPLAGRMKNGATVECNDEGAYFTEARVDSHLEEFLKHHHDPDLDLFMPHKRWETGSLLHLQITRFSCGGNAIGMRMCHVLADIAAASAFINDWATLARQSSGKEVSVSDSVSAELTQFFPPPPTDSIPIPETVLPFKGNLVRRKFTFDSTTLGKLKTKATQSGVKNPTRVQLVTALICLNDTREGDGIEAFVALEEQEMAVFERDEEILQFCYLH